MRVVDQYSTFNKQMGTSTHPQQKNSLRQQAKEILVVTKGPHFLLRSAGKYCGGRPQQH